MGLFKTKKYSVMEMQNPRLEHVPSELLDENAHRRSRALLLEQVQSMKKEHPIYPLPVQFVGMLGLLALLAGFIGVLALPFAFPMVPMFVPILVMTLGAGCLLVVIHWANPLSTVAHRGKSVED